MQRRLQEETKTLLINQILPLATIHLTESHTSRVIYDRSLLADMSVRDLSEVLTFLEGLEVASKSEMTNFQLSLLAAKAAEEIFDQVSYEHIDVSEFMPSDLARREFNPE